MGSPSLEHQNPEYLVCTVASTNQFYKRDHKALQRALNQKSMEQGCSFCCSFGLLVGWLSGLSGLRLDHMRGGNDGIVA